jgi:hypothetical protein
VESAAALRQSIRVRGGLALGRYWMTTFSGSNFERVRIQLIWPYGNPHVHLNCFGRVTGLKQTCGRPMLSSTIAN